MYVTSIETSLNPILNSIVVGYVYCTSALHNLWIPLCIVCSFYTLVLFTYMDLELECRVRNKYIIIYYYYYFLQCAVLTKEIVSVAVKQDQSALLRRSDPHG